MRKLLGCVLLCELSFVGAVFADNQQDFNNAYQIGKQNQFNLNLNQNSNFTTYAAANKIESSISNSAAVGEQGSKDTYTNANNDNNYLYNKGTQDIADCQNKSDPRCSTLNKYGDRDTQTQLQAYSQGISAKYYISVKPDPADSSCSTVTRKVPINQSNITCTASAHAQNTCHASISINLTYHDCDPTTGGCSIYQSDSMCTLSRPYIAGKCTQYGYNANIGRCDVFYSTCEVNTVFRTPGCGDSGGRQYQCGGCFTGGDQGDHNGCWNQKCTNYSQPQLATYQCKTSNYSDGCAGFK